MSLVALLFFSACGSAPEKEDKGVENDAGDQSMAAQELVVQGNSLLDEGKYKEAAAEFQAASELAPDRWDIHMNRAVALSRANDFSAALGAMEMAMQKGGDSEPIAFLNLGNIYQERGMYLQAVESYRAGLAVTDKPDVDMLLNLGSAYLFLYEYEKAEATYNHLRNIVPDDPRPAHGLALSLQMKEQYSDALQAYEDVHMIDPNFAQAYFNKGSVLAALDRYPEAVQALKAYIQRAPDGPYVKKARQLIASYQTRG